MTARDGFYRTVLTVVNSYVCFYSSEFLCTTDAELSYFVREDIPFCTRGHFPDFSLK